MIGASGIARTFMIAEKFGQRLEYEIKFKKIPDKLFSKKAKEIGRERLNFMEEYFKRLKLEINGEV